MQTLLTSRSWMWLLPFLAVAVVKAQVSFGVSGGPQLAWDVAAEDGERFSQSGFGFFGGGSLLYSINDQLGVGGDLLLSYQRFVDRETFFGETYKYISSNLFLKLPLTIRYRRDLGNLALEGGAGLQPFFWLSATGKVTGGESSETFNRFEDDSDVRRAGIALVLQAGVKLSALGIYLRYDPQLTSLDSDYREVQNTLGLMLTYWFGQ